MKKLNGEGEIDNIMEIWIRSQDKTVLEKVEWIEFSDSMKADNSNCIFVNALYVGEYKTKKRALEIIDEIQRGDNMVRTQLGLIYELPSK